MGDVPDQAGPSAIADQASSGSNAGTAAIGLACLRWTKAAAAHSRGAPLKRYGPPAALTAVFIRALKRSALLADLR